MSTYISYKQNSEMYIYIYIHRDTHTYIYISYIYTHTYLYICLFFPWKTGSLARGMPEKKCCCIHSGVVPSAAYLADSSWAAHSLVMQVLYSGSRLAFSFSCGACGAVVFVWRCLFRVAFPFSCGVPVFVWRSRFRLAGSFSSKSFFKAITKLLRTEAGLDLRAWKLNDIKHL